MVHSVKGALTAAVASVAVAACQSAAPISQSTAEANQGRSGTAPILQAVTLRTNVSNGLGTVSVVPDFHFIAPDGNAIVLRRELVDTNAAVAQTQIGSATINIPAEAQKRGAVISGGWRCGVARYYVRLRAYILDADGNRSNTIVYTIHCNGDQSSPPAEASVSTGDARYTDAAPILQAVTLRTNVSNGLGTVSVVPDFHFIAPGGNAIVLRRELVDTDGAIAQTQIRSATINIPAEAQKRGAVISGGWRCGVAQYYVRLRAYIMDADGNRSNAIEYTIHCNGG